MHEFKIFLNDKYWRTLSGNHRPAMNLILELIDQERHNKVLSPETNIDHEFRLDLGTKIDIELVPEA